MITPKIQNLFHFIEFLYSNIENFNHYEKEINELYLLDKERQKLNPNKNFSEKLEYDKIQMQIKDKYKVIQDNIIQPIKDKANELSICNPDESPTLWNRNIAEVTELKNNFSNEDLPVIFSHKNKYLEYRTKTKGETFFGLGFFFDDLDLILKELFNYFKETDQNEFEAFETKAIRVNYITEAVELLKQGHKKVTLPLNFLDIPKETQNSNAEPQQSHVEPPKTQKDTKQQPKLKIDQIALKYVYEGLQITRGNGNEIAEQFGHTSGEKLFQRFTLYSSTANRKGKPYPFTLQRLKNKIKLIESVIELLPKDKQARAIDEVSILNNIHDAEADNY